MKKLGKVYLVGAGPGAIDLITVKGLKCIQEADVILYDRLINKELLSHAKPGAELIYCGKLPKFHAMIQERINHYLVKFAKQGKVVTRLKGGDPFVFGRGPKKRRCLRIMEYHLRSFRGLHPGLQLPLMREFLSPIGIWDPASQS